MNEQARKKLEEMAEEFSGTGYGVFLAGAEASWESAVKAEPEAVRDERNRLAATVIPAARLMMELGFAQGNRQPAVWAELTAQLAVIGKALLEEYE